MNIDPLDSSSYASPSRLNGRRQDAPSGDNSTGGGSDHLSAELSASVRDTLASLPEVRPGVVERGRELLADPSYPNQEIVNRIAALITPLPED